jgi:hypothetical protein
MRKQRGEQEFNGRKPGLIFILSSYYLVMWAYCGSGDFSDTEHYCHK